MKRKIFLVLLLLPGLIIAGIALYLTFFPQARRANPEFAAVSPVRAMRVDYIDEGQSRSQVAALEAQMQESGVNLAAVSAGRADWTYFLWSGHPDRWSAEVKASGIDYLMEDSTRFGRWAHVSAVIDCLAPRYISSHPETAAISWLGLPSKNLVSTTELVNGNLGLDLVSMIGQIAADYPVNSITLAELTYYVDGFGDQDKAAYTLFTGQSDWPRNVDGSINIDEPSIGAWRADELGHFLERVAAVVHQHGKLLFVEARVDMDPSGNVIVHNGTDFQMLLQYADRIILTGSSEADGSSPQAIAGLARYASSNYQDRVILGIGLWERNYYNLDTPKNEMTAIPLSGFQSELQAAIRNGAKDLWVTPSFLMMPDYWGILKQGWQSTPNGTLIP